MVRSAGCCVYVVACKERFQGNGSISSIDLCFCVSSPPNYHIDALPSLSGVLIAIVVGIALVIGVLILTVGVVCLKR